MGAWWQEPLSCLTQRSVRNLTNSSVRPLSERVSHEIIRDAFLSDRARPRGTNPPRVSLAEEMPRRQPAVWRRTALTQHAVVLRQGWSCQAIHEAVGVSHPIRQAAHGLNCVATPCSGGLFVQPCSALWCTTSSSWSGVSSRHVLLLPLVPPPAKHTPPT